MPIVDDFNIRWQCSHCKTLQLAYMGDPLDLTIPDREAVRCYNCKRVELIGEPEGEEGFIFRVSHGLEDDQPITEAVLLEHAFIEDGTPIRSN